tara:strand:+ start:108055 stop:109218 length:1164 start_codon:yes stop_codon:yes gene_type:complete
MTASAAMVLLAMVSATPVEISTIDGARHAGTLTSADADFWKVESNGKVVDVPLSSILEARLPANGEASPAALHETVLTDGSQIGTRTVALAGDRLTIAAASTESIQLPRSAIENIRLAESPSSVDDQWTALLERERREDWLVLRKQDKLDFVPGVISEINETHVVLLLDGDSVPVPRPKVFGVILRQRQTETARPGGIIELVSGDRLAVQSVSSKGDDFTLHLTAGPSIVVPILSVRSADFSADKLTWLSSLKPRDIKHEFRFIDPAAAMKNDQDVWGDELRLGNQTFTRGLCIRSKTVVQYRLNGDYSRFVALMGIQHGYAGDVHVQISADGQHLLTQDVSPQDEAPFKIDLNISGKFTLEILVDYGKVESDIGDHLVLAEARLLK